MGSSPSRAVPTLVILSNHGPINLVTLVTLSWHRRPPAARSSLVGRAESTGLSHPTSGMSGALTKRDEMSSVRSLSTGTEIARIRTDGTGVKAALVRALDGVHRCGVSPTHATKIAVSGRAKTST